MLNTTEEKALGGAHQDEYNVSMQIVKYRRHAEGWVINVHPALARRAGIEPGTLVFITLNEKQELVIKPACADFRKVEPSPKLAEV